MPTDDGPIEKRLDPVADPVRRLGLNGPDWFKNAQHVGRVDRRHVHIADGREGIDFQQAKKLRAVTFVRPLDLVLRGVTQSRHLGKSAWRRWRACRRPSSPVAPQSDRRRRAATDLRRERGCGLRPGRQADMDRAPSSDRGRHARNRFNQLFVCVGLTCKCRPSPEIRPSW